MQVTSTVRQGAAVAIATVALVVATALPASAALVSLPKPATAATLATQVKASTSIKTIPKNLNPSVANIQNDQLNNTSYHAYNGGCPVIQNSCTFGDKTGKKLAVLFGDSHAWMWLASVAPALTKAGFKLQLIWEPGCPAAEITQIPELQPTDDTCPVWRTSMLATIKAEKPALVILAERTSEVLATATTYVTSAAWTAGLEATIAAVAAPKSKIVVIGDDPADGMDISPPSCLAQHPTAVQECSFRVTGTVAADADHNAAEKAAVKALATADHVTFIDPTAWLCTKTTCSEIVGTLAVYFDWSHFTATYGAYLSGVMGTKLKPLL